MGLNDVSASITRYHGDSEHGDSFVLRQYGRVVAKRPTSELDELTIQRAVDAQNREGVIAAAEILFPEVFAEPESKRDVGAYFLAEPLRVVAWLRFGSAWALKLGARWMEEAAGRDPDQVRTPAPERRFLALSWTLDELRAVAEGWPERPRSDAAVLETEGGAWALAYGIGVGVAGSIASSICAEGIECEVAGLRIQGADVRFPATTESLSADGEAAPDPGIVTDGTPAAQPGPALEPAYVAVISAPQGGPIYTHHFEGASVAGLLREIAEAVDLEAADRVDVAIRPIKQFRVSEVHHHHRPLSPDGPAYERDADGGVHVDETDPDNDAGAQG